MLQYYAKDYLLCTMNITSQLAADDLLLGLLATEIVIKVGQSGTAGQML